MAEQQTREPQYQHAITLRDREGCARFPLGTNQTWHDDPKRLVFMLARYKFVAKMLSGRGHVLEAGCGDGFGARLVAQEVERVTAVDFDPIFIAEAQATADPRWNVECFVHDLLAGPVPGEYEAAYCLDVLEHIRPEDEGTFLDHLVAPLVDTGVLIVGMPSLESQAHASPQSKAGHVNCKRGPELKELLAGWFDNVFLFSMNDEVVHTGYTPMAHYLLALACGRRARGGGA